MVRSMKKPIIKVRDKVGHQHGNDGRFSTTGGSAKPKETKPKPGSKEEYKRPAVAHKPTTGTVSGSTGGGGATAELKDADGKVIGEMMAVPKTIKPDWTNGETKKVFVLEPNIFRAKHRADPNMMVDAMRGAAEQVLSKHPDAVFTMFEDRIPSTTWDRLFTSDGPGIGSGTQRGRLRSGILSQAQAANEKAKGVLKNQTDELKTILGEDTHIKGRAKDVKSAYEKVLKQPDDSIGNLWDMVGNRVTLDNLADVPAALAKIRAHFGVKGKDNDGRILREKDYNEKPLGGYRSHHFNVMSPDGMVTEIQVATANQRMWADWAHNRLYKPPKDKKELVEANRKMLDKYAQQASDYYHAVDTGKVGKMPPCTQIVSQALGCLDARRPEKHGD